MKRLQERLRPLRQAASSPAASAATLPSPEVATIVGRINQLWGAHVRVYQSLAPMPPHAARGGCIFYNRPALYGADG